MPDMTADALAKVLERLRITARDARFNPSPQVMRHIEQLASTGETLLRLSAEAYADEQEMYEALTNAKRLAGTEAHYRREGRQARVQWILRDIHAASDPGRPRISKGRLGRMKADNQKKGESL